MGWSNNGTTQIGWTGNFEFRGQYTVFKSLFTIMYVHKYKPSSASVCAGEDCSLLSVVREI